jgi:hypothetical protein
MGENMVMAMVLKKVLGQYSLQTKMNPKCQVTSDHKPTGRETLAAVGATDDWLVWGVVG